MNFLERCFKQFETERRKQTMSTAERINLAKQQVHRMQKSDLNTKAFNQILKDNRLNNSHTIQILFG